MSFITRFTLAWHNPEYQMTWESFKQLREKISVLCFCVSRDRCQYQNSISFYPKAHPVWGHTRRKCLNLDHSSSQKFDIPKK